MSAALRGGKSKCNKRLRAIYIVNQGQMYTWKGGGECSSGSHLCMDPSLELDSCGLMAFSHARKAKCATVNACAQLW